MQKVEKRGDKKNRKVENFAMLHAKMKKQYICSSKETMFSFRFVGNVWCSLVEICPDSVKKNSISGFKLLQIKEESFG